MTEEQRQDAAQEAIRKRMGAKQQTNRLAGAQEAL